jgi:hypothetical protein
MTTALREAQPAQAGNHAPSALPRIGAALSQGVIAGSIGTATMSAAMLAARKSGRMGHLPPKRITHKTLFGSWLRHPTSPQKDVTATLLHFGFGGDSGALFTVLHRRLRPPISPLPQGIIFGGAVWFVSYMGWAPALGLMQPPHRDRPDRQLVIVLAHWIYGATLGAVVQVFGRRR